MHLSALPIEAAFAGAPQTVPCAVRSEVRGRRVIADVSDAALAKRILRGMTETEARARLPSLEIRARDPAKELRWLSAAAEMLLAFGPVVELAPPSFLFVDVGRGARRTKKLPDHRSVAEAILATMDKAGHRAKVVVAGCPDVGRSMIQHPSSDRVIVIEPGKEREALAPLPVDAILWADLRRDPDGKKREELLSVRASMSLLGVDDIGRLQNLPAAQVTSRFGDAGALLMRRAMGEGSRPLFPFSPPERVIEEIELDQPIDDLEPILFLLKRIFDRLEARLEARVLSARSLEITFTIEPTLDEEIDHDAIRPRSSKRKEVIRTRFARATRKAKTMLDVAREKLELSGAVAGISVEAIAKEIDRGAQLDLFTAHPKRVEEVGELVSRLAAALGDDAVFSPELADTHRPEAAWTKQPFDVERALEEPKPVKPSHSDRSALQIVAAEEAKSTPLPAVTTELCVTGAADLGAAASPAERPARRKRTRTVVRSETEAWPKPVPRKPEDEPVPDLPPRPLELLSTPEPASLESNVLRWRGQRLPVSRIGGAERLECEWWTRSPVARDYVIAEIEDGRRFWLFYDPEGALFVHGIFD